MRSKNYNLYNLRMEKGEKQRETAAAVGITKQHYCHLEGGRREGKITIWKHLAEHFNTSLDYLLEGTKAKDSADQKFNDK